MDLSAALLERDAELALVDRTLDGAERGRGAIVRVRGAAGLGKTRLLATIGSIAAERGFEALRATGSELEREFGFGVARQLFDGPVRGAPREQRDELLEGPAELAGPLLGIGALPAPALSPAQIGDLFHALYWLTVHLAARRPLLLVVDDLQLADEASLRFIAFLARRVKDSPVLAVVSQRSTEPLPRLVENVLAEYATEVQLAPLSAAATARLAAVAFGADVDPEIAAACWKASEGNPMLLRELLTTLSVEGVDLGLGEVRRLAALDSADLARAGILRLALLSERDRRLAAAIAVMDGKAPLAVIARVAQSTADESEAGLARLRSLGIVAPDEPARAVHALVREAIIGELAPGERSRLGRAAAGVLAEVGADDERVAGHLVTTEPAADPWVVERLRSAARSAMARGAPAAAATLLERASREGATGDEQGQVLFEFGQAIYIAAPPKAPGILLSAARLLEDARQRVGCRVLAARGLIVAGDVPRAVEVFQEAIDADLGPDDDTTRVLLEAEATGTARLDTRLRRRALTGIKRLERSLPDEGLPRRIVLAVLAGERSYQARPAGEMRELALEALSGGALLDELGPESPAFYGAAFALLLADDAAGALAQFDSALDKSRGRASLAAIPRGCRAIALLRLGRPGDAEVDARTALDELIERDESLLVPLTAAALVDALLLRGAIGQARAVLARAASAHDGGPSISLASHFLVRRGKLAIADGDDEAALALLLAAGEEERAVGCENPAATEWRAEAAIVALRLGRTELARALSESNLRDATTVGGPRMCGVAERVHALVGPPTERTGRLLRSAELLAAAGDGVQRAVTLLELAAQRLEDGDNALARGTLSEALELAERCGATVVAEQARQSYMRAGGLVVQEAGVGTAVLTPTERRVCELAAAGGSNLAIAQEMRLTSKAVESHLASACRKLDVADRGGLADALQSPH